MPVRGNVNTVQSEINGFLGSLGRLEASMVNLGLYPVFQNGCGTIKPLEVDRTAHVGVEGVVRSLHRVQTGVRSKF